MPRTVILSSARTPIGKLGGGLSTLPATHLGGVAIREALDRADVSPEQIQHVVMGTVLQAGQGQIPSRQAQIEAGIPIEVTSETINKVCASSVRAVGMIDQAVRAGDLEVAVGGGMESMSQAPYLLPGARSGFRMGDTKALDAMIQDGLRNPFSGKQMFEEATTVGDELEMTRADLDKWALRSHERALAATDDGRLAEEIIPVTITSRKGDTVVEVDEAPRRGSSLEALAKLPGLTGKDGSHTAGNSPGVNDGAGALVLASEDWAERNGKDILATIIAQAAVADEFAYLARTPANAAIKALDKAGLQPSDIDLWEINEAFSSVALNSVRMLGVDEERVNVNGGAVALGHPIGASRRPHHRRARAGAAPARRRLRLRGDLLRRRPGRRDHRPGVSDGARPHILPAAAGGGAIKREGEKGAAFFDLDRTLIAGSSSFQFGRAAYKAGMVSRKELARDAYDNVKFRLQGSTDASADLVKERVGKMLDGAKVRDLQRLSGPVLAGVLPRLYPRMLDLAYEHQDEGRPIFICTAAAQELAELLAMVLTFDGAVGSVAEVIDGVYTGREGGPFNYREGKAQALRELAEREDIDLAASYAYSDSESDLPMLRLVGHPVAVNPDKELARVAREEGWEIMRFERLGRKLRVLGAAAAVAGGAAAARVATR